MADEYRIRDAVAVEPLLDFARQTDAELLAALTAVDQPDRVPVREIRVYLNRSNAWPAIIDAAGDPAASGHTLAVRIRDTLNDLEQSINVADADVQAGMGAAVSLGWITAAQHDAILAMGDGRRSLAEKHGLGEVLLGDVMRARAL